MRKLLTILFFFTLWATNASGQIAAWNFGPEVKGDEKNSYSTTTDTSIEVSELSRGPGVTTQKTTYSFAGKWPACSSMIGAVRQGAYYQFTLRAKKDHILSLDSVTLVLRVQPNGPTAYILTYSTDGQNVLYIGEPIRIASTGNNGKLQPPIDLSQIAELQHIATKTTVTFRLYAWGGSDADDNAFRIGKSTPEQAALAIYGRAVKKR